MASGVPNLSLDDLGIDGQAAGGELDADGGLGLEAELVAGEAGEEVGLADAGVSDEDQLEEVVVVVLCSVASHWIGVFVATTCGVVRRWRSGNGGGGESE